MRTPSQKPPMSSATAEFGRRVREARQDLGLSQERLADGIAIHWSYLGRLERGQVNPTLHNVLKIAAALHVDPGDLVTGIPAPD